jgi:KTSC domain
LSFHNRHPRYPVTRRKSPVRPTSAADLDQPSTATVTDDPLEQVLLSFESPESTSVTRANYDPTTRQLFIVLRKGGGDPTYRFGGVGPQLWIEFYQSESKGKFFSARIRPFYVGVRQP